ncbi:VanZ family protein [Thermotoga sp. SG1]|uniref:VanZ family protein n=1 Tax=Thermotoga sp. SG1 TaxID=126739 RepID=UPI001E615349|nr:VanZ family protein [Thermotoga sp. SG1]
MRKFAHFGLYFIMGVLSFVLSYSYIEKYVFSILMGVSFPTLIAVLDEYNQSFHNRGSSLYDVIIDMNGAMFGVFFSLLVWFVMKLTVKK